MKEPMLQRRKFLKDLGYVCIGFSILGACVDVEKEVISTRFDFDEALPKSLDKANKVNSWITILEDGGVRVYSGKVEFGQGIRTAIKQVAAEELDMSLESIEVHLAETGITPNEGYTAASASIKNSAMSVRYAAASARVELLKLAAERLEEPKENLVLQDGVIRSVNSEKYITIQELLNGKQIETLLSTPIPLKNKIEYRYVGKAIPRADIKKMVLGEAVYIHDLRFPNMVHARVIRPPNDVSTLLKLNNSGLKNAVSGVLKTVVNGNFIGVIAEKEFQAIKAENYVRKNCKWTLPNVFPKQENLLPYIRKIADPTKVIINKGDVIGVFKKGKRFKSTYTKPYLKHASLGPACAIALFDKEVLHVWSHSQGIYPLREALASMLKMDVGNIHVVSVPGAGCYGHSTADDASADAALLAMEYPGKHVRVQWSRFDEHTWDPFGSAACIEIEASLDESGKIEAWKTDVWTDSHSTRPNSDPGTLLTARNLKNNSQMQSRGYVAGGHRNGDPFYDISNLQLNANYFAGPFRVSSLRSLGAYATIFGIESFIDELAEKVGKHPIDFRIDHLNDERAIAVMNKIKTLSAHPNAAQGEGLGFAFMRFKNTEAYVAVASLVKVNSSTGEVILKKMWASIDVGEVINLDGLKNQVEGGMIQAASWTMMEKISFDEKRITSTDWSSYPILKFSNIPEIVVDVIGRPNEPAVGAGEAAVPPTAASIANAVYKACGKRIYDLPITPDKIKASNDLI